MVVARLVTRLAALVCVEPGHLQECKGKAPYFYPSTGLQKLLQLKRLSPNVATICIDSANNRIDLVVFQKPGGWALELLIGEVDEQDVGQQADGTRNDTFQNEDPAQNC